MRLSFFLIPVFFFAFLLLIVLPRLLRGQSAVVQILPPTSNTPAAPGVSLSLAGPAVNSLPELRALAAPHLNGKTGDAVAVSVARRFSLPVVQQPKDQPAYVSSEMDVLTQFSLPRQYGTTGLLAHNFLSGKRFAEIQVSDVVLIVYGDGHTARYRVEKIESYQALSPTSPYSQFIDLSAPRDRLLSSADLFNRVYTHPGRVVFQTCIAEGDEASWGRVFITAVEIDQRLPFPTPTQLYNN